MLNNNLLNDGSVNNNEMHETEVVPMRKLINKVRFAKNQDDCKKAKKEVIKLFVADNIEELDERQFNMAYGACVFIHRIAGEIEVKTKAKLQDIEQEIVKIMLVMPRRVAMYLGYQTGFLQFDDIKEIDVWVDKDTIARGIRKHELSYKEILKALFDPDLEMHENSIEKLYFSNGTYNALKYSGINTIDDICKLTDKELNNVQTLGKKGCKEVKDKLNELGRSFKEENISEIPKEKTAEEKILAFLEEIKSMEKEKQKIELNIKKLQNLYENLENRIQFVNELIDEMDSKLAQ